MVLIRWLSCGGIQLMEKSGPEKRNDGCRAGCSQARTLVEHEHAVRREIVVAGEGLAGQKIVHRLVEGDAHGGILVVEQEINLLVALLPEADFDVVGHLEQRMEVAQLARPQDQVEIKTLLADRADVDGPGRGCSW